LPWGHWTKWQVPTGGPFSPRRLLTTPLGGHLKPDSYYSISRIANEYGIEAATELATFEFANVDAIANYVRGKDVDCDFVLTRAIDVQLSASHQEKLRTGYNSLVEQGVEATKRTYCAPDKFAERVSCQRFSRPID
jgi:predicted 3-demethylubiquinone-9 3-methyltransferase (glyoxalase superfamily)